VPFPDPFPWLVGGASGLAARLRGKSNSLNLDKIREATAESWACSCAAAERDLGFTPEATLIEQLQRTADWYRLHRWL
jgi:nucleoside-diphosphate-sugar epimerase